jgi:hypothetical protein
MDSDDQQILNLREKIDGTRKQIGTTLKKEDQIVFSGTNVADLRQLDEKMHVRWQLFRKAQRIKEVATEFDITLPTFDKSKLLDVDRLLKNDLNEELEPEYLDSAWNDLKANVIVNFNQGDKRLQDKCSARNSKKDRFFFDELCFRLENPKTKIADLAPGGTYYFNSNCKFPKGRKYPYHVSNLYYEEPLKGRISYKYKVKTEIPNVLILTEIHSDFTADDVEQTIEGWFADWDNDYPKKDKEIPRTERMNAFLCQVLGWNGIAYRDRLMLCGNGSRWLKYQETIEPNQDFKDCDENDNLPSESATTRRDKFNYYEEKDATDSRNRIGDQDLRNEATARVESQGYLDMESAKKQDESDEESEDVEKEEQDDSIGSRVRRRYFVLTGIRK